MRCSPAAMIRTSQASASSQPPPIAEPLRAAMKTAPARFMRSSISWKRSSDTTPAADERSSARSMGAARRSVPIVRTEARIPRTPIAGPERAPSSSSPTS